MKDGALEKALAVLEALVNAGSRASLAAVAAGSGVSKPTCHRILQTFVERGYAIHEGDGAYSPGAQILALAGQILASLDYGRHARPALAALQEQIPETVHFGILSGVELVYAEKLEGRRSFRMASTVGQRIEPHSTAIGKVVLAHLPAQERKAVLGDAPLVARTVHTITDPVALERELELIRDRGYAIDDEENETGIRCVGAPVFSSTGRVVGGVSVSAPAFLLPIEHARAIALNVVRAADAVSRSLGASASPAEHVPDDSPPPIPALAATLSASASSRASRAPSRGS